MCIEIIVENDFLRCGNNFSIFNCKSILIVFEWLGIKFSNVYVEINTENIFMWHRKHFRNACIVKCVLNKYCCQNVLRQQNHILFFPYVTVSQIVTVFVAIPLCRQAAYGSIRYACGSLLLSTDRIREDG